MTDGEHLGSVDKEGEHNICNGNCGLDCSCPGGCPCNREPDEDPKDATLEVSADELGTASETVDQINHKKQPFGIISGGADRGGYTPIEDAERTETRRRHPSRPRISRPMSDRISVDELLSKIREEKEAEG